MKIKVPIQCCDGKIYRTYEELNCYYFFNKLFKGYNTKITKETTEEGMIYKIPKIKLECSVDIIECLLGKPRVIIQIRMINSILCVNRKKFFVI